VNKVCHEENFGSFAWHSLSFAFPFSFGISWGTEARARDIAIHAIQGQVLAIEQRGAADLCKWNNGRPYPTTASSQSS